MKKRILVILLSIAVGTMAACASADPPVYASDEKFDIGMWVGVPDRNNVYGEDGEILSSSEISDADFLRYYRDVADAGFTIAYPGYKMLGGDSYLYNERALKAAGDVGIRQIIADAPLNAYLAAAPTLIDAGTLTRAEAVVRIKELIAPYVKYGSLYGFLIRDEPDATLFDNLSRGMSLFREAAPNLMYYVNLYPVVATGNQLGGGESIRYNAYVAQYMNKFDADYISYDHYPLYRAGDDTSLEASFLYNMDLLKRKVTEEGKGRRLWTFLQSIDFNKNRALESKADAGFQAYSFLAYGGDGIQWFCYASPPPFDGKTYFGQAMLDGNMKKTDTYEYVKAVNGEIQALMPYYKNFTWQGVMLSNVNGGEGNFDYISENALSSTDTLIGVSSGDDALVGCFEDKNSREGFMVVNFTDPHDGIMNRVTLSVSGAKNTIVVKNGVRTDTKIKGGKLTLDLNPGEGAFVIPY